MYKTLGLTCIVIVDGESGNGDVSNEMFGSDGDILKGQTIELSIWLLGFV